MVGEMSHRRSSKRVCLSLLQTNNITTAYGSFFQRIYLQENWDTAWNLIPALRLSLLRSRFKEYEIGQIKIAYFNKFTLFVDNLNLGGVEDERFWTIDYISEDHYKCYTRF